ncbi:MAG: YhdH/YhfP family quinone oxidoreductase [Pirellulales bacterium]|nr:YhdH/YhfP family quinone oxidoreductase [Pirellulales bacterium]
MGETFDCLLVTKSDSGQITRSLEKRLVSELPAGDLLVRVHFSSLNYKDALSATGHPGVVRRFPHVPGIDAAGIVVQSASPRFLTGDEVIVTGFELGADRWGGFAEMVRIPAEWAVVLPSGMTLRESMIYGTAGFTAAICLESIERQGVSPDSGPILVTGASGGVGSLAVGLLAKRGYRVSAVSGKPQSAELLMRLGASEILPRKAIVDRSDKPLLNARWAAVADTVGGETLATVIRSTQPRGCVAACGLVGGTDLPLTVYPFILRGVTLAGIDSVSYPAQRRAAIWSNLAASKLTDIESLATEVMLAQLEPKIHDILAGKILGRTVVRVGG